ncbi:MAG: hypothetical protein EBS19_14550 [Spirochaetia bacterium]|nr:hypothetical protein [Spirochaetia bacterium]
MILSLVLCTVFYFPSENAVSYLYSAMGEIANEDVISPLTADIEPFERDSQQKETLAQRVPPIFDYDENTIPQWLTKWKVAFKNIRKEKSGKDRYQFSEFILCTEIDIQRSNRGCRRY